VEAKSTVIGLEKMRRIAVAAYRLNNLRQGLGVPKFLLVSKQESTDLTRPGSESDDSAPVVRGEG